MKRLRYEFESDRDVGHYTNLNHKNLKIAASETTFSIFFYLTYSLMQTWNERNFNLHCTYQRNKKNFLANLSIQFRYVHFKARHSFVRKTNFPKIRTQLCFMCTLIFSKRIVDTVEKKTFNFVFSNYQPTNLNNLIIFS